MTHPAGTAGWNCSAYAKAASEILTDPGLVQYFDGMGPSCISISSTSGLPDDTV